MSADIEDQAAATVPPAGGAQWRAWLAGFEAGERSGRAQANQEWTDVTTLACRTAMTGGGVTYAALERRRSTYPTPPLTGEQIRAQAAWSLRQWERQIREPPQDAA